jgi:hypothetical protein
MENCLHLFWQWSELLNGWAETEFTFYLKFCFLNDLSNLVDFAS